MIYLQKTSQATQDVLSFLQVMLGETICSALTDDEITEIMVNPDETIWLEKRGQGMYQAGMISANDSINFLNKLAEIHDSYLTVKTPILEGVLPFNGERIEATVPPVTINPAFTIRKKPKIIYGLDDYIGREIITDYQADFIRNAVKNRKNILVSGGPGTGKTTLTNAIVAAMKELCDSSQRILILEDVNEIQCSMPNVYSMLTSSEVDMKKLLTIAMRSRPDRILVGEVRDQSALDLLKAWNTGCPGGIATVHANSAQSSVLRILSLSEEANVPSPKALVAESIDVVINVGLDTHHPSGRRVREIGVVNRDLSVTLIEDL